MKRATLAIAFAALIASEAGAQNPPPGGAQPGRGGGGGRGRGGVRVMTLTTSGFKDGGVIPERYAQAGEELSPPLSWTGAPDSTKSFVLVVHDLDAIGGNGDDVLLARLEHPGHGDFTAGRSPARTAGRGRHAPN